MSPGSLPSARRSSGWKPHPPIIGSRTDTAPRVLGKSGIASKVRPSSSTREVSIVRSRSHPRESPARRMASTRPTITSA